MTTPKITQAQTIRQSAALAFFASAYADLMEEAGKPLRGEVLDQLPEEIDPAALQASDTLIMQLTAQFSFEEPTLTEDQRLLVLYMKASNVQDEAEGKGDRELDPDNFGHYLAMQAMGHGVGLESFGRAVYDAIPVPYVEFGSHSLQSDYGQESEDE